MKSLLETQLSLELAEVVDNALAAQTRTYGAIDLEEVTRIFNHRNVKSVLDIGTGEGSFILKLATKNPQIAFTCLDQSEISLQKARSNGQDLGSGNVTFQRHFFDSKGVDKKYDCVFSRFLFEHVTDLEGLAEGCLKSLKPGGIFLMIDQDFLETKCVPEDPMWKRYGEGVVAVVQHIGGNLTVNRTLPKTLEKLGFKEVRSWVNQYSTVSLGERGFKEVTLATALVCHKVLPSLWTKTFVAEFNQWLSKPGQFKSKTPYHSICYVEGIRAT